MESACWYERAVLADATGDGRHRAPTRSFALFLVDEQTYALEIWEVDRIVRAVEVRPLPESPYYVRGVVNVQGEVLPVVDLRGRFGREPRAIRLEDHFIVARANAAKIVLPVDAALASVAVTEVLEALGQDGRAGCVRAVLALDSGLAYVLDLDRLVSSDDPLLQPCADTVGCLAP